MSLSLVSDEVNIGNLPWSTVSRGSQNQTNSILLQLFSQNQKGWMLRNPLVYVRWRASTSFFTSVRLKHIIASLTSTYHQSALVQSPHPCCSLLAAALQEKSWHKLLENRDVGRLQMRSVPFCLEPQFRWMAWKEWKLYLVYAETWM